MLGSMGSTVRLWLRFLSALSVLLLSRWIPLGITKALGCGAEMTKPRPIWNESGRWVACTESGGDQAFALNKNYIQINIKTLHVEESVMNKGLQTVQFLQDSPHGLMNFGQILWMTNLLKLPIYQTPTPA